MPVSAPFPFPIAQVIGIDHIYISTRHMAQAEAFYTLVLCDVLGFRCSRFSINDEPHVQFYNRHLGYVLRPARHAVPHEPYAPGLHHLCWRVSDIPDVIRVAQALNTAGIAATQARCYPEYAPDYWATYFTDPDGVRLEVTNYRAERRERHDHWDRP
jgi:catechol 2,3-dioxygenase-like lactoylglutathione lyase family enzyme